MSVYCKPWSKLALFLYALMLTACNSGSQAPPNLNMVISVSSDGDYAIATNTNKQAVLWNLQAHTYKIIFKNANIYSAYFIKNTDDFMYQNDATNEVVVENTSGQIIKTFNPGFATYGQVMTSDLNNYFASDENFIIYKVSFPQNNRSIIFDPVCPPDHANPSAPSDVVFVGCASFEGAGQLFGLTLTPDQQSLVGAADGGFNVWNVATGKLLVQSGKNDAETVAAINPDGHYLVTGDIMDRAIYYNLKSNKWVGYFYSMPVLPEAAAYYAQGYYPQEILAVKFIARDSLLVFAHGEGSPFNYAALFNPMVMTPIKNSFKDSPFLYNVYPIKYLPLIPNAATDMNQQDDWPLTSDDFSRDQAIDTSPSAHVLVMSQQNANGIIVYHFDPETQTLVREWSGVVEEGWF